MNVDFGRGNSRSLKKYLSIYWTFLGPKCHNQHIIYGNFRPLKGPITTFAIIFGPFWVPIVITNKIFTPILDLPKKQI